MLPEKYRPDDLSEIVGQDAVVESLQSLLSKPEKPHSYMFMGPTGTGKTSLARILAKELGCVSSGLIEIDAAKNSGIDNFREICDLMRFRALGSDVKVAIIDEAQNIRSDTWDSLLKSIEEPPSYFYWIFCTTEPERIKSSIKNRCTRYPLKLVEYELLRLRVYFVALQEYGLEEADYRIDLAVAYAAGCPRQALNNLEIVMSVEDRDQSESLLLLESMNGEDGNMAEVAKLMIGSAPTWNQFYDLLQTLTDAELSKAKPVLSSWVSKALWGTKDAKRAQKLAVVLDAIDQMPSYPDSWNKKTSLLMAIWRVLLN